MLSDLPSNSGELKYIYHILYIVNRRTIVTSVMMHPGAPQDGVCLSCSLKPPVTTRNRLVDNWVKWQLKRQQAVGETVESTERYHWWGQIVLCVTHRETSFQHIFLCLPACCQPCLFLTCLWNLIPRLPACLLSLTTNYCTRLLVANPACSQLFCCIRLLVNWPDSAPNDKTDWLCRIWILATFLKLTKIYFRDSREGCRRKS